MVRQDQDILAAAEALLGSSSSYQRNVGYNINSQMESVNGEGIITGSRYDGRMSPVRRFFCLLVTFDLLFTILMWLICIMINGDGVLSAVSKQVVHYSIRTSLFDIVMAAACRFVVLLLFYALLYIKHWYIVAISTAGTCAFLIAKVFIFSWPTGYSPVFQVLLILISFVLAWGEAWFLDFRVLPEETQASIFFSGLLVPRTSEQAPLLSSFLQTVNQNEDMQSVRNFYSPMESPHGSDVDEECPPAKAVLSPLKNEPLLVRADEIVAAALQILNSVEWKLEKTTVEGDMIHSKKICGSKVYRMTGFVDMTPRELLELLYYQAEEHPSWNPTILRCERVEIINDSTDILYQVTAEGGGGIISSRDFVNLRHWVLVEDSYVAAAASIDHPNCPPQKKYIRGENGPSCWVMRPVGEDSTRCSFEWLLNTNLHGWLPQSVVDSAFSSAMKDYIKHLRKLTERRSGRFSLAVTQRPSIPRTLQSIPQL